ncbi:MAG: AAA family ATPase [Thermoproteota archaeon]|jgi:exonuclease SbcC
MILKKVKLKNFISHKDSELEFGYGINLITGPNGAGKTSVLDAISFGLFGEHSRGKKEDLITRGENSAEIELEFEESGSSYIVEWKLYRKKPINGRLYRVKNNSRIPIVERGERTVTSEIEKTVGFNKDIFLQSVYIRQGEIESLITTTPSERKKIISKLLGIEDLERAYDSMKEIINEYENKLSKLSGELSRKKDVEQKIEGCRERINSLETCLRNEENKLDKIKKEIEKIKEEQKVLEEKRKKFSSLNSKKLVLSEKVENLQNQLKEKELELRSSIEAYQTVTSLESEVMKLSVVEKYVNILQKIKDLSIKKEEQEKILEKIKALEKDVELNERFYKAYNEKNSLLLQKRNERKKYEGAEVALSKAEKQLKEYLEKKEKKNDELSKELEKYSRILEVKIGIKNIESVLQEKKNKIENIESKLEKEFIKLNKKIGTLKEKLEDIGSKLAQISKAEICPVCKRQLTKELREKLERDLKEEKLKIKKELYDAKEKIKRLKEKRKNYKKKSKQLASIDPEKVREIASEIEELETSIEYERDNVKDSTKKLEALKKIDDELKKLEDEIKEIEKPYKKYEFAKQELETSPRKEGVENELNKIIEELKMNYENINGLLKQLGYTPKASEEELKELRRKKEVYDRNKVQAEKKIRIETEVSETKQKLFEAKSELDVTEKNIKELSYDENKYNNVEAEYNSKIQEKSEVEKKKVEVETKIKDENSMKLDLEKELNQLLEKENEKENVEKFVKILEKVRAAFHKDGLQRLIRIRSKPILEKFTRDFFEKFNLGYSDIQIDEDYNISLVGQSGLLTMDQISGGERVALAISLRLAIARVLSSEVKSVIMDEPTIHLDEERRKNLVNILGSFFRESSKLIPQMIIVTHDREIEEVADIVHTISRREGYSKVESL